MVARYGSQYTVETLFFKDSSEGYDWSVVAAYKRSDDAFAVITDGGCSCNSYEEEYALDSAEWFYGVDELYRKFDSAVDNEYNMNTVQKFEAKANLRLATQ